MRKTSAACTIFFLFSACFSPGFVGDISPYVKQYKATRVVQTGINAIGIGGVLAGVLRGAMLPDGRIYYSGSGFVPGGGGSQNVAYLVDPVANSKVDLSAAFSAYNDYGGQVAVLMSGAVPFGLSTSMTGGDDSLTIQNLNTGTLTFDSPNALTQGWKIFSSEDYSRAWLFTDNNAVQEIDSLGNVTSHAPRANLNGSGMIALSAGRYLATGGTVTIATTTSTNTTSIYDSVGNSWSAGPLLQVARRAHAIVSLGNNRYLIAGGQLTNAVSTALDTLEILDLGSGSSRLLSARLTSTRTYPCAATLSDGRVLIVGGTSATGTFLATTDLFYPDTEEVVAGPALPGSLGVAQCFPFANANKVILGFGNLSNGENSLYRFELY